MKFKIILIILLVSCSLSITGCWDMVELNERTLITGIGIDKGDETGKLLYTVQSVLPERVGTPMKGGQEKESPVRVVSVSANSLPEAITKYKLQTSKRPYFQTSKILVIGEDAARAGIGPIINFYIRNHENATRNFVVICKGKAADVLKRQSELSGLPADDVVRLINTSRQLSGDIAENIHEFALKLAGKVTSPVTLLIEIKKKEAGGSPELNLAGTAVFKKDKLVGWLDEAETRGLARLIRNSKGREENIESGIQGEGNVNITNKITRSKTKIEAQMVNGRIVMLVEVEEDGMLYMQVGNIDLNSQSVVKSLEESQAEKIRNVMMACLHKVQKEFQTDIFGYGEIIHNKFPQQWKQLEPRWDEEFANLEIQIKVKFTIRELGEIKEPIVNSETELEYFVSE